MDSNPAPISDAEISWHDKTDGGNYTLDRKSGKLTVIIASSTGGYFLYDRCRTAFDYISLSQRADSSVSPVRMRTACSTGMTKTLPSPIFPVFAVAAMVSTALST